MISLFVNLGFLVYFKYANFFIESFVDSFSLFGIALEISTLEIILPVGISFYTFQTLSYTIDLYRKKIEPAKDVISFFAFVSFFPQLVAGPIERASHLLPQFYIKHKFDYSLVKSGLLLMAYGLFKKMVVADRAAVYVNSVYNNVEDHNGLSYLYATVLFAFQIYCDFSGYSDIAIGASRTMGFDLMKNFDAPYFSKSLTEFWRRWHISLSTWFRDYVYIPLGGSRKGKYRTYFNLFLVFLVSGLWHGAAWTFIIWGALHGIVLVFEKAIYKSKEPFFKRLGLSNENLSNRMFFGTLTFFIVCLGWVFFRANGLDDALTVTQGIFTDISVNEIFAIENYTIGFNINEFKILMLSILLMLTFEAYYKRRSVINRLNKQSVIARWSFYLIVVMYIAIFGIYGETTTKEFIYFQF